MNRDNLRHLLEQLRAGDVDVDTAMESLEQLPFEDMGFARVDHHRELRTGLPEAVYAPGKTTEQIAAIVKSMALKGSNVLVTRLEPEKARHVEDALSVLKSESEEIPDWTYDPTGRVLTMRVDPFEDSGRGMIAVVCAGTSDLPVATEAVATARLMNHRAELIADVGVAGLHRILAQRQKLREAEVVIVAAGMEGALTSVVAGLINKPIIGVPTSTGYGASFEGVAALLTMLNSCSPGVTVVNIDNGYGAAASAVLINQPHSSE